MNKRVKKLLFFIIVFNIILFSFTTKTFAREISEDIDSIDESQYPGIKSMIQDLKTRHPNWKFKVEYTNLSWEEVINAEHQGHSASDNPSNLVQADSPSYGGLWVCEICGNQRYDTGSWYCASVEALEYMMDPRNSLNDSDLFQFMQLSGFENFDNETVRNTLKQIRPSWIDDDCIEAIIEAGNTSKVDPYYILAKILEEQSSTSPLFTGKGYDGYGIGYYNVFNIGATANSKGGVMKNGLDYSISQGWNSRKASIIGGVQIIAQNYISQGQDTLYYQKFDVIGDSKYEHQYQQNVLGAQTAGTLMKKYCSEAGNYSFIIPLYKGTPTEKCSRPNVNQSHVQNSNGIMGDINGDNDVNVIDVVMLISYLNGNAQISPERVNLAKVAGNSNITVIDVVKLIGYLNGNAVLPSPGYQTATLNQDTMVRLSQNGSEFKKISQGMEIKILKLAESPVADVYWDLVVGSNGVYGYIPRNNYN